MSKPSDHETEGALYDRIGGGGTRRAEDPRLAAAIHRALGSGHTAVNVGAGAGSYEPGTARSRRSSRRP
jgi:hypothetical protein